VSSQVETLIQEKRALEPVEAPSRIVLWEDSADFTQFLLKWNARPKVFSLSRVFAEELFRRQGLKVYGVRLPVRRRSKVNQIHSADVRALAPRPLDVEPDIANASAA
jgi:hypothetical protein